MNKGHIVYQGLAANASQFFCLSGFPIPEHENPADHFLDVISGGQEAERLRKNCPGMEVDLHAGIDRPRFLPRETTPWIKQFLVLFRRSAKEQWRKRNIAFTLLLQSIIIAVLIGTVFLEVTFIYLFKNDFI